MDSFFNIGMTERRNRRIAGFLFLILGGVLVILFYLNDTAPWVALTMLPLFYQGIRFLYDYQTGTCPLKAELGQEKLEGQFTTVGSKIEDQARVLKIRDISREAQWKSIAGGVVLTALAYLLFTIN